MISWASKLSPHQKRIWMIGGTVVVAGAFIKYGYFKISRGLVVDGMAKNHLEAKKHLANAKAFAQWSAKDRHSRLPPLTDAQRAQLREYLDLVAEKEFGESRPAAELTTSSFRFLNAGKDKSK